MKILMVNKFFYIKGGSETYYFALKEKLEQEGHKVVDFSMKDSRNFTSDFESYFVENVDYNESNGIIKKIKIAANIIYSSEAKKKFEALVQKERPDVIHLHIFQHQLSPSILDIAKKYGIPTVYTAHDLKMLCSNYKMMHHGRICEECKGGKYYHCIQNKCVKDSCVKSAVNVIEGYLHKWKKSYDVIKAIITPSEFYQKKFEEFGVETERVVHIPNFLDSDKPYINTVSNGKKYYVYFGRLSEEKGIFTLIHALQNTHIPLYIIGTGPLEQGVKNYIDQNELDNISLLGFKKGQELTDLIGNAKAVILPSEWYENGPYSAIEALQMGRPLIGADIGGIPELVDNNGFLFKSGDASDLLMKIEQIEKMNEIQYTDMENRSSQIFEEKYTWRQHYKKLKKVYEKVMNGELYENGRT